MRAVAVASVSRVSDPSHVPAPSEPAGRVRRAPRYRRFTVTGIVLGILVAVVAVQFADPTARISRTDVAIYLAVLFGGIGGLLGLLCAVSIERRQ